MLSHTLWRPAPRIILMSAVALMLIISTVAIGNALSDDTPTEITLVIDDGGAYFEYGTLDPQDIEPGRSNCDVNPDASGAGFVTVTHGTFNKQGNPISGKLGLVEDGLGVNANGRGNGQDCGRIDYLDAGRSETMTLQLGSAVQEQMIEYIDFDFEAKFDAELAIEFFRGTNSLGTQQVMLSDGSDSGPDSKFRDKYRVYAYPGAPNGMPEADPPTATGLTQSFNKVVLTMVAGSVSLEGGATWDESPTETNEGHRTVFHLVSAETAIGIDAKTNDLDDAGFVPVDSPISWTYFVTNEGDLPLINVTVSDDQLGVNPVLVSDDENGILEEGETWRYEASGTAEARQYNNTATASGDSELSTATAQDSSGYFGSAPSLDLTASNNAVNPYIDPDDGELVDGYIDINDEVTWDYTVTNDGNVNLVGVAITDDVNGTVCNVGNLDIDASGECSVTSDPALGLIRNTGRANGTGPGAGGDPAEATADSSYFGADARFDITITNNGVGEPPVVSEPFVIWTITATNLGNVPITVIAGAEDGTDRTCTFDNLQPKGEEGDTAQCTIESPVVDGPVETSFTVTGSDPLGIQRIVESGTVGYYGGLACGESSIEGGEDVDDTPLAYFWVGPHKNGSPCAVPVIIETTNTTSTEGGEQTVNVAPPAGFPDSWDGVTGLVTIEWDVEVAVPEVLRATLQRIDENDPSLDIPIPSCTGPTAVGVTLGTGGFYELDPLIPYPEATDGRDVCLVQHFFQTVTYDPDGEGGIESEVRTRSVEVFYIWNDPKFVRR